VVAPLITHTQKRELLVKATLVETRHLSPDMALVVAAGKQPQVKAELLLQTEMVALEVNGPHRLELITRAVEAAEDRPQEQRRVRGVRAEAGAVAP
jgi:hypothetical protein